MLDDSAIIPVHWWSTDQQPGIWGRELKDAQGRSFGLIGDVLIDRTGRIGACRVSDGILLDLLQGRFTVLTSVGATEDGQNLQTADDVTVPDCMKDTVPGTIKSAGE